MSAPVKVLIVGPKEAGKTTIANFVAEHTDSMGNAGKYNPTAGARVLEFERDIPGAHSKGGWGGNSKVPIELWDVSGDHTYENCWPAITKDAQGVIIAYNPSNRSHEQEVALWYEWFCKNADIPPQRCLVFAHTPSGGPAARAPKGVQANLVNSSFEQPDVIRKSFDAFLGNVCQASQQDRK